MSGGVLKRMMNHAAGGDVTLGHYVGKSEAQLRVGWQTVADFVEAAAARISMLVSGADSDEPAEGEREAGPCTA